MLRGYDELKRFSKTANVLLLSYSREDQEEQGQREVQGALQQVPVHPRHHGQGEGREAEAVPASRWVLSIRQSPLYVFEIQAW